MGHKGIGSAYILSKIKKPSFAEERNKSRCRDFRKDKYFKVLVGDFKRKDFKI